MDASTIALAIGPGVAIMLYIYWRDKNDREPFKHLIICFLLGILAAVIAVPIEVALDKLGIENFGEASAIFQIFKGFIVAALVEEICKYSMVRLYAYPKKAFNEPLDGIVYSVMVAMGFATIENLGYLYNAGDNAVQVGILRSVLAVPGHACWGVVVGYFLGKAKFSPPQNKVLYILLGLVLAIVMHGAYDSFLFIKDAPEVGSGAFGNYFVLGALVIATIGYIFGFLAIRLHRKVSKQLFRFQNNTLHFKEDNKR